MQILISILVVIIILLVCALPGVGIAYVTRRKLIKAGNSKAKMISIIVFIVTFVLTVAALALLALYNIQLER